MGEKEVDLRHVKSGWLTKKKATAINSDLQILRRFVEGMPKAELHLHLEGTLEPPLQLAMAKRNKLTLDEKWCLENEYNGDDEEWIINEGKRRSFENLEQFLRQYYAACKVLQTEQDFYDLAYEYFKKASSQNLLHVEVFFDVSISYKTC
jgi:adenosine deaminase